MSTPERRIFREMLTPPNLHFVDLGDFRFVHTEFIPQWAKDEGYSPEHDIQAAVFGPTAYLTQWLKEKGLPEDKYPIHPSSMGTHIDIYGRQSIKKYLSGIELENAIAYVDEMTKKGYRIRL